jgi:hypothetical protein
MSFLHGLASDGGSASAPSWGLCGRRLRRFCAARWGEVLAASLRSRSRRPEGSCSLCRRAGVGAAAPARQTDSWCVLTEQLSG